MARKPDAARPPILVVDDDGSTRRVVEMVLRSAGFEVRTAPDGRAALKAAAAGKPAALVVDLLMPELDGLAFCAALRAGEDGRRTPVLVLSARAEDDDRRAALAAGADDYMRKPFDPAELVRRVRSMIAPCPGDVRAGRGDWLVVGALRLDPARGLAHAPGRAAELTPAEAALLAHLMRHAGEVFSAEALARAVFGAVDGAVPPSANAVHGHVRQLRRLLEADPARPMRLVTAGRKGYRLEP